MSTAAASSAARPTPAAASRNYLTPNRFELERRPSPPRARNRRLRFHRQQLRAPSAHVGPTVEIVNLDALTYCGNPITCAT